MLYCFTENGWEDYLYFQNNDKKTRNRINELLKDISRNGANYGIGKPEPLIGSLSGFFSRRIDDKNRLIYKVEGNQIFILACRHHYSDH